MARRRDKKQPDDQAVPDLDTDLDADLEEVAAPDVRHAGPWDSTEKATDGDPEYADLGALRIRVREGLSLQLPTDGEGTDIGSAVLVAETAALELRAFAASRSGGIWNEVRDDLILEVERLDGQCEQVDGIFGPELHVRVPVEVPDGEGAFQPSRIVGIEGPRWFLRATFLGDAGLNPSDDGLLMDSLRDVVVVRGADPRIPREALLLTLPENATVISDEG